MAVGVNGRLVGVDVAKNDSFFVSPASVNLQPHHVLDGENSDVDIGDVADVGENGSGDRVCELYDEMLDVMGPTPK